MLVPDRTEHPRRRHVDHGDIGACLFFIALGLLIYRAARPMLDWLGRWGPPLF
jgi:hypothetical protein